ncbi:N-acetylmuramoyl-L-alanine amidase [Secundilactobacillus kimchicus]|uniref:N-acetylmuramoyl-L-alanine amidase n=1 Tax=Secundilactobacillus kimchicus TaxID=528209 RepID=UPI0024A882BB|nr:peptidoglycan recognition family protein [Secundilactobacillus kimchicus]
MMFNEQSAARGTYSRYDAVGPRPIHFVVIHATQLDYFQTVERFTTDNGVSAHYLIRHRDGAVTQFVNDQDVAWHAGNWAMNAMSIGIELEAFIDQPAPFSMVQLRALVRLLTSLTDQYQIQRDRAHIIGHDNVPAPTATSVPTMHTDPGLQFDWAWLLPQLGVINPRLLPPVIGQPIVSLKNTVSLYRQPDQQAPLTTEGPAWTRQLSYGQLFECAALRPDWIGIWYNGKLAWLQAEAGIGRPESGLQEAPLSGPISVTSGPQTAAAKLADLPDEYRAVVLDHLKGPELVDCAGHIELGPTRSAQLIWLNHRLGFVPASSSPVN